MADHTEHEFKLRATQPIAAAAVDGALRDLGIPWHAEAPRHHVDVYLDDDRGSLRAARIGLRLRTRDGDVRIESKTGADPVGGLFVRRELAADWQGAELPRTARDLPPAIRDLAEPFVLDRPLRVTVRLATRRDTREVGAPGDEPCELVVDEVEATAGDRRAAFHEVEIEFRGDATRSRQLATALQRALPLVPATDDKPEHAARLLGLAANEATPAARTTDVCVVDAVVGLLSQHLVAMRFAEVGVRAEGSAEDLHRMRVAARRLRSVVRAFRELWPDDVAARLLGALADGSRELAAVRDFDVLLASLAGASARLPVALRGAAEQVAAWIRGEGTAARAALQATLRSDDRLRRQTGIEGDLAALDRTGPRAQTPVAEDVPLRIARAAARVRKLLRALPPDLPLGPLHELRIASKRLRYVAEQFADLPGIDAGKALDRLAALQQATGDVCDCDAAAARLLEWLRPATAAGPDGALTAAAIGGLAAKYTIAADKARKVASRAIARLDRKRVWRRFAGDARPDANLAQ